MSDRDKLKSRLRDLGHQTEAMTDEIRKMAKSEENEDIADYLNESVEGLENTWNGLHVAWMDLEHGEDWSEKGILGNW